MEATIVRIDNSLGFKVPEMMIRDYNLKVGTKINMNFLKNDEFVLQKKAIIREGWDTAFAQYALDGEDKTMLPDFLDTETDIFL